MLDFFQDCYPVFVSDGEWSLVCVTTYYSFGFFLLLAEHRKKRFPTFLCFWKWEWPQMKLVCKTHKLKSGQENLISGVHCYNKATGYSGIGIIYLQAPGLMQIITPALSPTICCSSRSPTSYPLATRLCSSSRSRAWWAASSTTCLPTATRCSRLCRWRANSVTLIRSWIGIPLGERWKKSTTDLKAAQPSRHVIHLAWFLLLQEEKGRVLFSKTSPKEGKTHLFLHLIFYTPAVFGPTFDWERVDLSLSLPICPALFLSLYIYFTF